MTTDKLVSTVTQPEVEDQQQIHSEGISVPFEQLKIFGLEGIKLLSGQINNVKEKTKSVFSKALGLFRRSEKYIPDNVNNDIGAVKSGIKDVGNQGKGVGDAQKTEESVTQKEKKTEQERISIIEQFQIDGLGDLFFKLKEIYLQIAAKQGKMDFQEGPITEKMIAKFAIQKIAEFERGVVRRMREKHRMNSETAMDFIGHRFKLASQVSNGPIFQLVKIKRGKQGKVELFSDDFLTFGLSDRYHKILSTNEKSGPFLKADNNEKIASVVPTSLNEILFGLEQKTHGNVNLYNDYYEVFERKASDIVGMLRKLSQKDISSPNKSRIGLLNEIIYTIGEPFSGESFSEYLDRYLWGKKLSSIYKQIGTVVEDALQDENGSSSGKNISNLSAKQIFDIVISRLNELNPELIADMYSLKIGEFRPNDEESLRVYFSRVASRDKKVQKGSAKSQRVLQFLQTVVPDLHRMILLDRERQLKQKKHNKTLFKPGAVKAS